MRPKIENLLMFALLVRVLTLILPWLTIALLFPEKTALNFSQFTHVSWSRWDASHYLYLAENWYTNVGDPANFIVFFPLYPLVLKGTLFLLKDSVVAGIVLSTLLFLTGFYYFYKLIAIDYPKKIAGWAVMALAIFPTSYFFNAPYTESLFLLIFSITMYSARKENWILSGIFAGLGTLTRPFGILLLPAILIEWFTAKNKRWKVLPVVIIPTFVAGLLYLYLNKIIYGNPLEFQNILAGHWQKYLVSPISSIMDSWRIALSGGLTNFVIMVGWAEAVTITISWILMPIAFMKLRKSWAVFYSLSILLFSSTSFILSTPRYLLSIPPFFVLIAIAEKNYLFRIVYRFASVALLICLSIIFTRGQWAF